MAGLGDSFRCPKPDNPIEHLWIVITSPCPKTDEVIMVNVTGRQAHSDLTTVLAIGEHPYVKKPSVAFYADARVVMARKIDAVIAEGYARPHKVASPALLERLQQGILNSPHASQKAKDALRRAQIEGRDKPLTQEVIKPKS